MNRANETTLPVIVQMILIEQHVAAHPRCTALDIAMALDLNLRTMSHYVNKLKDAGRLIGTANHGNGNGSRPMRYAVVAGLLPLEAKAQLLPTGLVAQLQVARRAPVRDTWTAAFFGAAP